MKKYVYRVSSANQDRRRGGWSHVLVEDRMFLTLRGEAEYD